MTYILFNPLANSRNGEAGILSVQEAYDVEDPDVLDITSLDVKTFLLTRTDQDLVILCGGDGTIHHLVNRLEGEVPSVPIRLWRFGTGNDFIRDVSNGQNLQTVPFNEYIENLPITEANGEKHRFLNGCSAGVDAMVCLKVAGQQTTGRHASYVGNAIHAFFRDYRTCSGRVTVDGETRSYDRIWMAGAMNGRYQGGGMLFGPGQDRKSPLLTSYVWHGTSPVSTLLHFPSISNGSYVRFTRHCDIRSGREITVELDAPQPLQMDGEVLTDIRRFRIRK